MPKYMVEFLYKKSDVCDKSEVVVNSKYELYDMKRIKTLEEKLEKTKNYDYVNICSIEEILEKDTEKYEKELKKLRLQKDYYQSRLDETSEKIEIKERMILELEGFELE